jgi:hypothetical protein
VVGVKPVCLVFRVREGFAVGGGGCETPPSRILSEGGIVVGRKGSGGGNPQSCVLSKGEACGGWWWV